MSEPSSTPPAGSPHRSPAATTAPATATLRTPRAPLVGVLGVFALFALFLVVLYYVYVPRQTGAFTEDGIRTGAQRTEMLVELRKKEAAQLTSYAWIDQQAGAVQLPLDRAMELTLEQYQKQSR